MGSCPKCGARVKQKNKSLNVRVCHHCGPIENVYYLSQEKTMQLEAKITVELDNTAKAEVILTNYKGQLVIWSHNAASLDYARKALASYIEVFITQNLGEYITKREYTAVKAYKEIFNVEEVPAVDIQI